MTLEPRPEFRTHAFINGAFVEAMDGSTFETLAPATGQPLAAISACGPLDVDRAVGAARAAFDRGSWSNASPGFRKKVLLRFAQLIDDDSGALAALESIDAGKPITDCRSFDIPDVVRTLRWYAEAVDKVFGKVSPTGLENLGLIVREPIGVVGAVLPWNFPSSMLAWKLGPALAAGNCVVVKPPELASLTTLRIAELATEAGMPEGVINVVPGLGPIAGRALGLHPNVDMITFTGSTEVGREFLRYSADSNLKEIVLECGGKNPQIVMADNLDRLKVVADDLVQAAFWNAGQNCSAGSRILVDRSIKEEFTDLITARAARLVVGDPSDESTEMGPLIEAAALDRVLRNIERATSAGAVVTTGGLRALPNSGGFYMTPTVLTNVTRDMSVAREELFGPVVSILEFSSVAEAVSLANDTEYGLAATVWSHDIDVAIRIARGIRAGTVAVNGYSEGDITTPFGGYGTSGFGGRDNGLEAIDQYTQLKTIWLSVQ